MKCDLIIISYNTCELVVKCIESAISTANSVINQIIVADNNSSDDTISVLKKKFPHVVVIQNEDNYGYSKAVNIGVAEASSELVLISNSDIVFLDYAIANLIELFENDSNVAVAGVRQIYPDGTWQYSYGDFPNFKSAIIDFFFISNFLRFKKKILFNKFGKDLKFKEVDYADGGLIAVRKSDFDAVSGFDEDYFFYSEDMDFCFRIKENIRKVVFYPNSKVVHLRGASSNSRLHGSKALNAILESKLKFALKHLSKFDFLSYSFAQIIRSFIIFIMVFPITFFSEKINNFAQYHKATYMIWNGLAKKVIHNKQYFKDN